MQLRKRIPSERTSTACHQPKVREIGKYHLVAELARGGMGNVYLAVAQGPGGFSKLLVVKELKVELCDDPTYVTMFLDEARLAARLIHPNIVQTNEIGSDGKRHYLVMEYLDGRSLHRIAKRLGERFPIGAHLRILVEALLGLDYAHETRDFDGRPLGIVHRDVSPLNVFVTFAGQAKVLDFGIAKTHDSSLDTAEGVVKGRIAYMAPEQARGMDVDRRADIYSAGVMLWEAAAQRRMWPGMTEVEILTRVLRDGPPALRTLRPHATEELEAICARAMAKRPEDRYPTVADLLHDLEGHLARRSDTMTMREIGALVGQAFAVERQKMNAAIEGTVLRLGARRHSGVMPTFHGVSVGPPTSANVAADELSLALGHLSTPNSSFPPSSESFSRSAPATSATLAPPNVARPARFWAPKWVATPAWGLAAGAAAIFLGAVVITATLHRGKHAAASALVSAVAAATQPTTGGLGFEAMDLTIRVSPSSAQISVDGASVTGNPFFARYPRDGRMHHVAVSADGYESKLEDILFASDVSIDVSLRRRESAPVHQSVVMAPAATAHAMRRAAPPATSAADALPPLRPISTSNPYGNP